MMTLLLTALILVLFKNKFLIMDDIGQRTDTVMHQHGPLTLITALQNQATAIPVRQRSIIFSIADLFKKHSRGFVIRLPLILGFRILRSLTCWNDFYNTQKCLYK